MSLAKRSVTSVAWNVVGNLTSLVVLFVRSILLARWLPVETFGVYAFANAVVAVTVILADFGFTGAFLHRSPETEDEEQAAAVHLTLKCVFVALWAGLLTMGSLLFTTGETRTALLLLVAVRSGTELIQTPELILTRRVIHRRLALLQLVNALVTTAVALALAWGGATLWALLATDVATLVVSVLVLYVWRPVWRPRLTWSPAHMRYFLRFGSRSFLAGVIYQLLDRVDDLWTGIFLGKTALGFYSRAYTFATYPRRILAAPVSMVASGTYAELKYDSKRLSQAFFRTNSLLIRSGFLLAGLLALLAPEFIHLAIGDKWLPMLTAFRLMLVFTLFDPLKITVSHLFVAVGCPEKMVRARALQLVIMVIGLFVLGPIWGIAGVALAVDLMLVFGIGYMLWQARPHVQFSVRRMFAVPSLALAVGLGAALAAVAIPGVEGSYWRTGAAKAVAFCAMYAAILIVLERDQIVELWVMLRQLVLSRPPSASGPGGIGAAPELPGQDGAGP